MAATIANDTGIVLSVYIDADDDVHRHSVPLGDIVVECTSWTWAALAHVAGRTAAHACSNKIHAIDEVLLTVNIPRFSTVEWWRTWLPTPFPS